MKIINANAEYLDPSSMTPYAFMEKIGRICYKSENNITDDSSVRFVNRLFKNKHTAMLEHAHIILKTSSSTASALADVINPSRRSAQISPVINYINISSIADLGYVSASFRAFINLISDYSDNGIVASIRQCLADSYPEIFADMTCSVSAERNAEFTILTRDAFVNDVRSCASSSSYDHVIAKHMTHTIVFTCDRGVSHELVRHRPASFAQESTRYCNYAKDKFGKEITFIRPVMMSEDAIAADESGKLKEQYNIWKIACEFSEKYYFAMLDAGAAPQTARDVLNTSVKTEIAVTATETEWSHILSLRFHGTTGQPHPQMLEIMKIARPLLMEKSDNRLS